jgi:hypothetical protein
VDGYAPSPERPSPRASGRGRRRRCAGSVGETKRPVRLCTATATTATRPRPSRAADSAGRRTRPRPSTCSPRRSSYGIVPISSMFQRIKRPESRTASTARSNRGMVLVLVDLEGSQADPGAHASSSPHVAPTAAGGAEEELAPEPRVPGILFVRTRGFCWGKGATAVRRLGAAAVAIGSLSPLPPWNQRPLRARAAAGASGDETKESGGQSALPGRRRSCVYRLDPRYESG